MVESTSVSETMDRNELAGYLRDLADEFEGEGDTDVVVGNKRVMLLPPQEIDCDIEVDERSSMLGDEKEVVEIAMSWTPPDSE